MSRITFIILSVLQLSLFSACESETTNKQQNAVTNSSSTQQTSTESSNINGNTEQSMLVSVPTPSNRNTVANPPQIFIISDAQVERAFAEGLQLYQDIRRRGGDPPPFGEQKQIEFLLPEQARLLLSIIFKTPLNEAKERGYNSGSRSAGEQAEILRRTKQDMAQRSKEVFFKVHVKEWRNPRLGDDNTPSVQFTMKDVGNRPVEPTNNPQLDFCVGNDTFPCLEGTEVKFPLYRNEQPLLTNGMDSVTLTINVNDTAKETSFRLR